MTPTQPQFPQSSQRPFPLETKQQHGQSPPLLTLPRHRAILLPPLVPPARLSTPGLLLDPGRVLAFFLPSNSSFPRFPLETSLFSQTHCRSAFPPGVPYFTLHSEGVPSGTVSSWLGRADRRLLQAQAPAPPHPRQHLQCLHFTPNIMLFWHTLQTCDNHDFVENLPGQKRVEIRA